MSTYIICNKKSFSHVVLIVAILCATSAKASQIVVRKYFDQADKSDSKTVTFDVSLKEASPVKAQVQTTHQGNGVLSIPGISLRLMDKHDDGLYYKDDVLRIETVRETPGGSFLLVVSGIFVQTGEKESDPRVETAAVYIYRYDCNRQKFDEVLASSKEKIRERTEMTGHITCKR